MDDPTLLDRWDIIPNSSKMTTRQACQSFYERLPELVPVDFRYSSIRPDVLPIAQRKMVYYLFSNMYSCWIF